MRSLCSCLSIPVLVSSLSHCSSFGAAPWGSRTAAFCAPTILFLPFASSSLDVASGLAVGFLNPAHTPVTTACILQKIVCLLFPIKAQAGTKGLLQERTFGDLKEVRAGGLLLCREACPSKHKCPDRRGGFACSKGNKEVIARRAEGTNNARVWGWRRHQGPYQAMAAF